MKDDHFGHLFLYVCVKLTLNGPLEAVNLLPKILICAFCFSITSNSYITYDVEEKEKVGTFLINDRKRR